MDTCPHVTCAVHGVPLVCPAGIGTKGGQSQSKAKREASHENLKKARERRWPNDKKRQSRKAKKRRKRSISQSR